MLFMSCFPPALSGAAHFIIQFSVQIDINCDTINNIRNMTNQYGAYIGLSFEDLPGTEAINAFCNQESHTIEAIISLGKVVYKRQLNYLWYL